MSGSSKANSQKLNDWKKKWKLQNEHLKKVVDVADRLHMKDGQIQMDDYIEALGVGGTEEDLARRFFYACDTDRSGVVDEDEMLEFYGNQYGDRSDASAHTMTDR